MVASGGPSIFGNLAIIENYYGCLSIIIIVTIVLLLEKLFSVIQSLTADSPFEEIVIAIKNEMMIGKI